MSIDVWKEDVFRITDAPRVIPSHPTMAQVRSWIYRGVRGHRLEIVKVGGVCCTSREAVARFCESVTTPAAPTPSGPVLRTPQQRRRAASRADRQLAAAGW